MRYLYLIVGGSGLLCVIAWGFAQAMYEIWPPMNSLIMQKAASTESLIVGCGLLVAPLLLTGIVSVLNGLHSHTTEE